MAKIKVSCIYCGKEIERFPSQCLNTIFCSKQCRADYMRENNTVTFKCDYCGEEKRIRKSNYKEEGNHFCTRVCKDKWQKEGLKGENNPFYDKIHSKTTKEMISDTKIRADLKGKKAPNYNQQLVKCDECGKSVYKIPYLIKRSKYNFCSIKCNGAWKSKNNLGENNPTWNPDLTDEERKTQRKYPEYYIFLSKSMKRDNYTCDICGKLGKWGKGLNVHHLNSYNWDKENRTNIDNGVTLCKKCHKKFHNIYGYGNNTKQQYKEFKELRESIA